MLAKSEVTKRLVQSVAGALSRARQHPAFRFVWFCFFFATALMLLAVTGPPGVRLFAQAGPCDPPNSNQVVCENAKPGSPASEWDITGAGDATIQGFATDISVNRGQRVRFKVSTPSSSYHVEIYRLGYYSGMGARKVATVTPSATLPQSQPACLTDSATGLVDCGNWAESAFWDVPADAVSGIYIARLERLDTGGASHIVFIVRDDARQSGILFQTSDTTWQAYNRYGGNSLYTGAPVGRAYKVSYNRPFNTRAFSGGPRESWLFGAEYPMLRWLEANGFDVAYTTGVDSDRRGGAILGHKIFMSVGHDEYWSGTQRSNVEAARNAGVHLAFFSANEVFWKTRWENSIDVSGTPHRTLVCYKETLANAKIDPMPNVWTGTWRDPRFSPPADGGRPENALTGTIFTVNGVRNDPMTVPASDGRLRFWRNTSLANLQSGQIAAFANGILGYEWDEDLDNGFRPPGLINLSSTTIDVSPQYLQDYGATYGGGVATHRLSLHRHSSGALVFGAGTVQWSWGLDPNHDNAGVAADVRIQQATVNLLADMSVQPLTVQPGLQTTLGSTDATPPASTISTPAAGASIPVGTPVVISGTATDLGGVVGAVEVSTDNGVTWRRAQGRETWSFAWNPTQTGTATIRSRGVDDSANIESPGASISLTITPDATPPTITNVQVPSSFANWATITWNTNEPADTQLEYGLTTAYGSTTPLDPAAVTNHVASPVGLTASTTYHFRVRSRDPYGNLAISSDFSLTTSLAEATQTVTFDDLSSQNQPLNGQYPAGILNWGTNVWFHSQPWGAFTTKSVSFNASTQTSGIITAINPLRLLRLDAYNGGTGQTTVSVSCPGQTTRQVTLAGGSVQTVVTGWTQSCASFTLGSSNGWNTNFDTLVFDSPTDTVPPVISAVQAGQVGSASATIQWTTNEPADSQVEYGATTSYGSATPLLSTAVLSHSMNLIGLTPNSLYHYRVRSRDGVANLAVSGDFTFTTAPPDTTPPALSAIQATLVTSTSARISWLTSEPANTQVEYGSTTSYGASTTLDTTMSTGHGVSLAGLTAGSIYHFRVKSRDGSGNLAVSSDFSFVTPSGGACPCSLWPLSTVPAVASQNDTGEVELGVRFSADTTGFITGVRFYKGPSNTGVHAGRLWSAAGTLLATATFTNETALGWQEVTFASPVAVSAGAIYVASYHAPSGGYAINQNYFTVGYDGAPLHAAANGNGVYAYGPGGFPTATFGGSNYWVDVVFTRDSDVSPPVISAVQATQVTSASATIRWTTNELADSQVEYGPTTAYGSVTSIDPALVLSHSATVSGLTPNILYHYRVRSRDAASNAAMSGDFTFTTTNDTTPPAISSVQATLVTDATARISWVTNEPGDTQIEYGSTTNYGSVSPLDGALSLGHAVPLSGLTPGTPYHYRVRSRDAAGNLALSADAMFTTAVPGSCPCSFWSLSAVPAAASQPDTNSVEVGVRFSSDTTGYITGVRFYKGPTNPGVHIGNLWTAAGELLATATFTNETSTGWQEVAFATPVPVMLGTTYVASYFAPNGGYALDENYFQAPYDRAPLHAASGGNGVFRYGTTSGFPTTSFNAGNYWVDVLFVPGSDTTPPTISAAQATLVTDTSARISWRTNEPSDTQVEFGLSTTYGVVTPLDSTFTVGHAAALTGLAPGTLYHYRVRSRDSSGNLVVSGDLTFKTSAPGVCPCSLWNISAVPVLPSQTDTNGVEVGVRFSPDTNGLITALRFYKGPSNPGLHVGHLWTITGDLLATAVFVDETASGWQEGTLSTPVAVTAGTTYIASYYAPSGGYALTQNYFSAPYDNAPLHAPGANNGVFRYGATSGFPTSTANASNYWVDVVFVAADPTPAPLQVSIADVSMTEGNSATTVAGFVISLSQASTQSVTVSYATTNGTATAGSDYTAASGTVTFEPGATQKTANVTITGDVRNEPDETFLVSLSSPVNVAVGDGQATGTIVNDDPLPQVNIANVTVTEGNTGTVTANLTVSLSAASGQIVKVAYATANGTATAGADYITTSGVLTFAAGTTSQAVQVSIIGDTLDEANETFTVGLTSPENAVLGTSTGTGTITDNDATPSLQINDRSVVEGDVGSQNVVFTVVLSAVSGRTVTVNYATGNATASAGADYVSASGVLTFSPGVTSQDITVAVNSDIRDEADETFNVNLSGAVAAAIADSRGVGTIVDDDATPTVSINDVSVTEGNSGTKNVTFTLTLSGASGRSITVTYATADGTALAGSDYTAKTGTVTFSAGVVTRTFTVSITGDAVAEPNETLIANLSNPINVVIADGQGVCTIVNND
jgi:hypothetical protein